MPSIKLKICAAALIASVGATAALANQSGSFVGPWGRSEPEARAYAIAGANARCASYGGLQSISYTQLIWGGGQNWAWAVSYTCNN